MVLVQWPTDLIDLLEDRRYVVQKTELRLHVIECTRQRTFSAWAVVTNYVDDERVITESHSFDSVHNLADLNISVFKEAGKDFLHSRVKPLLICRTRVPR